MSNVSRLEGKGWTVNNTAWGQVVLTKKSRTGGILFAYVDIETDEILSISKDV